jgi:hypothetical protein
MIHPKPGKDRLKNFIINRITASGKTRRNEKNDERKDKAK